MRFLFFFEKGVDVYFAWCSLRGPFLGVGVGSARHRKSFLNFFQKGVDVRFFSRMLLRPSFGGALPINGRESGTLVLFWVSDFGSDGPMFFEN